MQEMMGRDPFADDPFFRDPFGMMGMDGGMVSALPRPLSRRWAARAGGRLRFLTAAWLADDARGRARRARRARRRRARHDEHGLPRVRQVVFMPGRWPAALSRCWSAPNLMRS